MSNARFARPLWHLVDAQNQIAGRLATQVVGILRGKHKPTFSPNMDCGDYVVIVNADKVKFTGQKFTNKQYTWHTGYPGGIKHLSVKEQMEKKPEEVLRKTIMGMFKKKTPPSYLKGINSTVGFELLLNNILLLLLQLPEFRIEICKI